MTARFHQMPVRKTSYAYRLNENMLPNNAIKLNVQQDEQLFNASEKLTSSQLSVSASTKEAKTFNVVSPVLWRKAYDRKKFWKKQFCF